MTMRTSDALGIGVVPMEARVDRQRTIMYWTGVMSIP
jgi:hypothetical protein